MQYLMFFNTLLNETKLSKFIFRLHEFKRKLPSELLLITCLYHL